MDARTVLLHNVSTAAFLSQDLRWIHHSEGQSYLPFCLLTNPPWWVAFHGPFTRQERKHPWYKTQGTGTKPFALSSLSPTTFQMLFSRGSRKKIHLVPCNTFMWNKKNSIGPNRVQTAWCLIWKILGCQLLCKHVHWVCREAFACEQWESHF